MNAGANEPSAVNGLAVELCDLCYTYPGRRLPTLDNLSFSLSPGGWTVLAGRSGSGKSTLLRALAGLMPRHVAGAMSGRVQLFGLDSRDASPAELATRVGLVQQSPDDQLACSTVEEELAFGLHNLCWTPERIVAEVERALAWSGLHARRHESVARLSGGQKQKLLLAAILAMRPRLLLLDEPLSQLDSMAAGELLAALDVLCRDGMTIVVAEHRLDEIAPWADRLLVLDAGRVAVDAPLADLAPARLGIHAAGVALPEIAELAVRLGLPGTPTGESLAGVARPRPAPAPAPPAQETPGETVFSLHAISARYAGAPSLALQEVSLDLRRRDCVALVGANGSGKTTLLGIMAGLLAPCAGEVKPARPGAGRAAVGMLPQNPDLTLFCSTVAKELAFGPRQYAIGREETAQLVATTAERFSIDKFLYEPPQALSQGQRLRAALAAACTLRPEVLLLDEPTTGQDHDQVAQILSALETEVKAERHFAAAVFATHDVRAIARYANRVWLLLEGRIIADVDPRRLLESEAWLAAAAIRLPPLFDWRRQLGLRGLSVDELANELGAEPAKHFAPARQMAEYDA